PSIAEGEYIVGRWISGGKHTGCAFDDLAVGKLSQLNTGKEIYFSATTSFTPNDGKFVDVKGEEGALTALQQLGLVAPSPGKKTRYDAHGHQI
ncbi:hypothetical protein OIDMADRAFT_192980, partial [Oidiodendron maius Zn]